MTGSSAVSWASVEDPITGSFRGAGMLVPAIVGAFGILQGLVALMAPAIIIPYIGSAL